MSDPQSRIEAVAAFGDTYREEHLDESPDSTDPGDDPFQVRFFLKRAFAGAKPESLATEYRTKTETVLRERESEIRNRWSGSNGRFTDEEFLQILADQGVGNNRDRQMVVDIVDLLGKVENHDITSYTLNAVKEGNVDAAYETVSGVYNIGPKKATVYLRDIVCYYDLEKSLQDDQYKYVLPIDTWVFQVGNAIDVLSTDSKDWERNSTEIVDECGDDVSPIAFNQGAWYLGRYTFEVLLANVERIEPFSNRNTNV